MDFLREYGAVIDFQNRRVAFATESATEESDCGPKLILRITDNSVIIPQRSSLVVEVTCDGMANGEAVADTNLSLLFNRGARVARGVVLLRDRRTHVLITNFSSEHRHLFGELA